VNFGLLFHEDNCHQTDQIFGSRHEETSEAVAITVKIDGRRARGRQRTTFLDWLTAACGGQWTNENASTKKGAPVDRQRPFLTRHSIEWDRFKILIFLKN